MGMENAPMVEQGDKDYAQPTDVNVLMTPGVEESSTEQPFRDVIIGGGEVGHAIFNFLRSKGMQKLDVEDIDMEKRSVYHSSDPVEVMHVCFPYVDSFNRYVKQWSDTINPELIIIHSTVKPNTTSAIQQNITEIPIIYSPIRGVHNRFTKDLEYYSKFYSMVQESISLHTIRRFQARFPKNQWLPDPTTLELAKILCDTSYYAWLISYAQITKRIADHYAVNYHQMWSFAKEIHDYLGNRPKMYPGYIGGHCCIPNIELLDSEELNFIKQHNELFKEYLEKQNSKDSIKSSTT